MRLVFSRLLKKKGDWVVRRRELEFEDVKGIFATDVDVGRWRLGSKLADVSGSLLNFFIRGYDVS